MGIGKWESQLSLANYGNNNKLCAVIKCRALELSTLCLVTYFTPTGFIISECEIVVIIITTIYISISQWYVISLRY